MQMYKIYNLATTLPPTFKMNFNKEFNLKFTTWINFCASPLLWIDHELSLVRRIVIVCHKQFVALFVSSILFFHYPRLYHVHQREHPPWYPNQTCWADQEKVRTSGMIHYVFFVFVSKIFFSKSTNRTLWSSSKLQFTILKVLIWMKRISMATLSKDGIDIFHLIGRNWFIWSTTCHLEFFFTFLAPNLNYWVLMSNFSFVFLIVNQWLI